MAAFDDHVLKGFPRADPETIGLGGGLGEAESSAPVAGEVIYRDAAGNAHSRRWNWRQGESA